MVLGVGGTVIEKGQGLRLIDVFVLGPFMMWAGAQRPMPEWSRGMLIAAGLLTIGFNLDNYLTNVGRPLGLRDVRNDGTAGVQP